ncbi:MULTISPECIES: hypothetical protein [Streptomyces]|uniref:Uncharacterized protein n=1 Tax=Streptomyces flaveolus TaxID=67297 RepID=A0ABV1VBP1_9ACTN
MQTQLLQDLIEKRRRFGLLAAEKAGQHGEGGTLDLGQECVKAGLDEPVGPDMPTDCPLARDVAELLEGVITGHQSLLGR